MKLDSINNVRLMYFPTHLSSCCIGNIMIVEISKLNNLKWQVVHHNIFFANIKACSFLHKKHQSRRSKYWLWINKILVGLLHHDNYGNSIPNDWTKRYSVNPKVFLTLVLALNTKTLSLILLASAFFAKSQRFFSKNRTFSQSNSMRTLDFLVFLSVFVR